MAEPALPQKPETTRPLASFRPPPLSPRPPLSRVVHPLPMPAGVPPAAFEAKPASRKEVRDAFCDVPIQPGPKKETARMTILSQPSLPATGELAPGTIATSKAIDAFDSIPGWFCWGLLGLSALIFLIQIWNYALS